MCGLLAVLENPAGALGRSFLIALDLVSRLFLAPGHGRVIDLGELVRVGLPHIGLGHRGVVLDEAVCATAHVRAVLLAGLVGGADAVPPAILHQLLDDDAVAFGVGDDVHVSEASLGLELGCPAC